jgi:hypothetical protein
LSAVKADIADNTTDTVQSAGTPEREDAELTPAFRVNHVPVHLPVSASVLLIVPSVHWTKSEPGVVRDVEVALLSTKAPMSAHERPILLRFADEKTALMLAKLGA